MIENELIIILFHRGTMDSFKFLFKRTNVMVHVLWIFYESENYKFFFPVKVVNFKTKIVSNKKKTHSSKQRINILNMI